MPFFSIGLMLTCGGQTLSSGAPEHPRIQLVQNGALISVQFGDAVALCARGMSNSDYSYRILLILKQTTHIKAA